jgi:hypothetical protein
VVQTLGTVGAVSTRSETGTGVRRDKTTHVAVPRDTGAGIMKWHLLYRAQWTWWLQGGDGNMPYRTASYLWDSLCLFFKQTSELNGDV